MFKAGTHHSVVIDQSDNIYAFGRNDRSQLGLGCNTEVYEPHKVALPLSAQDSVKQLVVRGARNYVVTEQGKCFAWPMETEEEEDVISQPFQVCFPLDKISVQQVSAGLDFCVLLATNGLVFSMGTRNSNGELGQGDREPRSAPCLISSLKNTGDRFVAISSGFKHTLARSTTNKIYTWGWGGRGQLGHGRLANEYQPRLLVLPAALSIYKFTSIAASMNASWLITNNRKLLWCGSNSQHKCLATPAEYDWLAKNVSAYLRPEEFYPLKVEASWSKSLSITYLRVAEVSAQTAQPAAKSMNTFVQKWSEAGNNLGTRAHTPPTPCKAPPAPQR